MWSYQVGDSGIRIRCPDMTKTKYVTKNVVLGVCISTSLKDVQITPADVSKYIENNREQLK